MSDQAEGLGMIGNLLRQDIREMCTGVRMRLFVDGPKMTGRSRTCSLHVSEAFLQR